MQPSIDTEDLTLGFDAPNLSLSFDPNFNPDSPSFNSPHTLRGGLDISQNADTKLYGTPPTVSLLTRVQLLANRLIYTRLYACLYFSCMLLNLLLLVYGITHFAALRSSTRGGDVPGWYAVLDVFATLLLVAEVLIRIAASPSQYFKSKLNWIDMIVLCLSFLALFLYSLDPGVILAENFMLILRYGAQLFRSYLILKHHLERNSRLRSMSDNQIDFSIVTHELRDESIGLMENDSFNDDPVDHYKATNIGLRDSNSLY